MHFVKRSLLYVKYPVSFHFRWIHLHKYAKMKTSLFMLLLLAYSIAGCSQVDTAVSKTSFVGCTPCDSLTREMLDLPAGTCDFIRWDIQLNLQQGTYLININFGEGKPNTSGFKNNGGQKSYNGKFTLTRDEKGACYQ
jgi:hypothetical protein